VTTLLAFRSKWSNSQSGLQELKRTPPIQTNVITAIIDMIFIHRPSYGHQGMGMKIKRLTNAHKSKAKSDARLSFGNMAPERNFFLPTNQRPKSVSSAIGAKIHAEPCRDQTTPVAHLGMPDPNDP
jgi:hypothetical protein